MIVQLAFLGLGEEATTQYYLGVEPKILVPQNAWSIMENPIKMDDLGGKPPLFLVQHPFADVLCEWTPKSNRKDFQL